MKKRSLIIFVALALVPLILLAQISSPGSYSSVIMTFLRSTTAAAARSAIGAANSGSGGALTNAVIYGSTSGNVTFGATGSFIGTGTANGINVATAASELHVGSTSTSSPRGIMSAQYSTGTNGARFYMRKARGTEASPTVVATADDLGNIMWSGYDGSSFLEMASIRGVATGTIAANRVPTQLVFSTATDASPSVLTDWMTLNSAGSLLMSGGGSMLFNNNAGINIKSSSGGTVGVLKLDTSNNTLIGSVFQGGGTVIYATSDHTFYNYPGSILTETVRIKQSGLVGIGTTVPEKSLDINSATGACLQLTYNDNNGSAANKATFDVSSGGDLTVAPSGSDASFTGRLASTPTSSTLAAAATAIAVTANVMTITGDAGANTVATITGGLSGQILTLIFVDSLVTITDDATGNANTVNLSAAFTSTSNDTLTLVFNGTSWREVARSVN